VNRDEAQAHCILAWNLQSQAIVNIGLRELRRHPGHDICSLLVYYKRLTTYQAEQVKRAIDRAIDSRQITLDIDPHDPKDQKKTKPLSNSQLLARIEKANDLINTFKMSAPNQSLNPPAKRNPGLSETENLGLQDNLSTHRVEPSASKDKPPVPGSSDQSTKTFVHTTKEDLPVGNDSGSFMGMTFTGFNILGEIGSGAMGVVLRAWHIPSKKVCALKVLFEDETDKTIFARLRREAKVLQQLDHPHIVKIIEHGYENNAPYLAMEFVIGKNLKEVIERDFAKKKEVHSPEWAIETLLPIANAIQYCHERGAIHRDIKPTNIVLESTGRPVLVDFGLVKKTTILNTSVNAALSAKGEILGTPAYMAPEQLDAKGGHGEVREEVDVWGFAATMFYCLTMETPFREQTAMATYLALLTKKPRRLQEVNKHIPAWLDQLCYDCLQREISKRPTIQTVITRLENRL
jgi:predicted Ser/Thr protein kinase